MIHMTIFGKRVSSPSLGHFAQAIVDASQQYKNVSITEPNIDMKPDAVIYASRSNDYFADAVSVARQFAVPLLVVSTDVKSQLDAQHLQVTVNMIGGLGKRIGNQVDASVTQLR